MFAHTYALYYLGSVNIDHHDLKPSGDLSLLEDNVVALKGRDSRMLHL